MNLKKSLHLISYLQYVFLAAAMIYMFEPIINYILAGKENFLNNLLSGYGDALFFMGLGISFSTLADTTKTHNNFSKRIWQNPKKGKFFIKLIAAEIIFFLVFGLIVFFVADGEAFKSIGIGCVVLSIGLVGMLKTGIEYFENHRLDKLESHQNQEVKPL